MNVFDLCVYIGKDFVGWIQSVSADKDRDIDRENQRERDGLQRESR